MSKNRHLTLEGRITIEVFASLYGEEILKMMDVELIPPDKVTLRPSLLK